MTNPTWIYVGALYAVAVWLVRRSGVALRRRIAFFFYALVLLFLCRPMTQAYVDVPVDCITRIPPWGYVDRPPAVNCAMNDIVTQMVPWADEVRDDWKALRVPLWSARSGSGSALLANMQSQALSPLRLLALPLPLGESLTAEAAMKLLVAMTGAFLFCRRRDYSEVAGAAGAVAFGLCTFVVVWLHFAHATVAVFLPAVLLAVDLLGEQFTRSRFAFAVVVFVAVIVGGHPETAFHVFLLAAAYLLWSGALQRAGRRTEALRSTGAAFLIAVLIATPLLLPFAEALRRSDRLEQVRAAPPAVGFVDRESAKLLVQPAFFGAVPFEPSWGPAVAESISGFAGILGFAGWVALLVDAIATRRWRTREMFFVIAAPLVAAIILQWPLVGTGFHAIFGFAANARMRLLLAFVMAMLAAGVIDLIERRRTRPVLIGIAAAAALLVTLVVATNFPNAELRTQTLVAMIPSALVLALAALRARVILLAAIVVEVFAAGYRWNPVVDARRMYPETPLIRKLQSLRTDPNVRVVGLGSVLYPNTGSIYGFDDIRSHDPMANARYLGVLRVLTGYNSGDYFAHFQNADSPLVDFLNVGFVVTDPQTALDPQHYELAYSGADGRIYRNRRVVPRFFPVRNVVLEFRGFVYAQELSGMRDFAQSAIVNRLPVANDAMRNDLLAPRPGNAPEPALTITQASDTDFRMRVHAPRWALVASSQPSWPGWRVEAGGKRVDPLVVNGAFLGFTVPPGDTDVRVYYFPGTFYAGLGVSLATILSCGVVLIAKGKR